MSKPLIQLDQIVKSFGSQRVLDRLNWRLLDGECAVILGPSGSGKSVFLNILLGLLQPDDGEITLPGLDAQDPYRSIAVMFQEDALLDARTVAANLAVACEERADLFGGPFAAATETAIDDCLRDVRLDPSRIRKALPSSLSGGMRRRVALARALIRKPSVLIADEPTTGLDPASSARVYDLIGELIRKRSMSAIIITHDPACASRLGFPVYYFSPLQPDLPRWQAPPEDVSPEDRHRDLLLWMHGQSAIHLDFQTRKTGELPTGAEEEPLTPRQWLEQGVNFWINPALETVGRAGLLLGKLAHRPSPSLLLRNLFHWGLGTIPLTFLIFLMLGVVMQIQAETAVVEFGFSNRLPELVALSLFRLSPILVGFLMAGRCGSAISAQTGWMQLAGQFRALKTMRIQPEATLFPPLFWSLVISTPLLMVAGVIIGAGGALLIMASPISQADITVSFFIDRFPAYIEAVELLALTLKGVLMGGGLALIAFSGGIRPKRSPADVTLAITRGLVMAFVWMTLVDTFLSLLFPL